MAIPILDLDVERIRVEEVKMLEDCKISSGGILKYRFNESSFLLKTH